MQLIIEGTTIIHPDLKGMWLCPDFPVISISEILHRKDKEIVRLTKLLAQRNKTIKRRKSGGGL